MQVEPRSFLSSRAFILAPRRFRPALSTARKAYEYARQFAAIGPRWPTGPGHVKAEDFLRAHFLRAHDQLEEDTFTADTPIGPVPMCNFIVRFPGKKPGVIVLGTHYETNYPLRNINFVGANDGASTTGLLMAIADQLRAQAAHSPAKKLDGYSVWLVFFDGEEAIQQWSRSDSTYGSRHLAAKWGRDGTLNQIKAFMLADMIGDKDLDIQRETHSTAWLVRSRRRGRKKIRLPALFLPAAHGRRRRSSALCRARRAVDRHHRSRLRPQQQLPPHRAGHDGQNQRAQSDRSTATCLWRPSA